MTDRRWATRRSALKFGAVGSLGAVTGLVPMVSQAAPEGIEDCTTIDEPGEYELKNDITGGGDDACIEIRAEDVTLDGNGYRLEGDGTGMGVFVHTEGQSVTVQNLTVRNFEQGIWGGFASDLTVRAATVERNGTGIGGRDSMVLTCVDSVVRQNEGTGIRGFDIDGMTVRDCEIRDNGGSAVGSGFRAPTVIENCVVVGNGGPVGFSPVPGSTIEGTRITESDGAGIGTFIPEVQDPDEPARITDCYIADNEGPGINHDHGSMEVTGCTVTGNRDGYYTDGNEINRAVLRYNNIEDNEAYGAIVEEGGYIDEIDAECNYWGHESGPTHEDNPRSEPNGQPVSDRVDFTPWSVERIEDGEGVCIGGQEQVGYISQSSFAKGVGDDEVACVPDGNGWGETFYVRREARNGWSDEGVVVDVPNSSQRFRGYLITATGDATCSGGPSGEGPWGEDCGSWVFVDESQDVQFDVEHSVHDPEVTVAHEAVQPTNGDGQTVGNDLDLVRTTFAPFDDE